LALLEQGLTAGSILLATAGWIYTAAEQRHLARRTHTFNVLLSCDITGELATLLDEIDNRARAGPALTAADVETVDPKFRRAINFNEFVCAAIRDRTLDEGLIRNTLRTRMLQLYDYSRDFILALRIARKNPAAMEHFEWFAVDRLGYDRWKRQRVATAARTN
jgi:hypothetical protein